MVIRTVIFDVDDTLYDFHHADHIAVEKLISYTAEQFGWSREEYLNRQKNAMADVRRFTETSGGYRTRILRYQRMLESAGLPIWPHALAMCRIYIETLLDNMIPEKGIAEWMGSLKKQGIRIGIASDATTLQQFLKLEKLGLLPFIDFMVTSEEAGTEKPSARFFERCSEKCLCDPDEVMFIGDNPEKDYAGAEHAGYHAVWYNPSCKQSMYPMIELRSYNEAPDLLANIYREK